MANLERNFDLSSPALPAWLRSTASTFWHQRRVILTCTAISLFAGIIYCLWATPTYQVQSRLYVRPNSPITDVPSAKAADLRADLFTQCELLTSTPIIAAALEDFPDSPMFADVDNTIAFVKEELTATVGKKDALITLALETPHPADGAKLVQRVIDAYTAYQARQNLHSATELLKVLQTERTNSVRELGLKNQAMLQLRRTSGTVTFENAKGNLVLEQLSGLSDALAEAQQATIRSKALFDDAYRGLSPAAQQRVTAPTAGDGVEDGDPAALRVLLNEWRQRLEDARQRVLPHHSFYRTAQARVDQLTVSYVRALQRQWESAKAAEQDLETSYLKQQQVALNLGTAATEYAQLQADVRRLETSIDILDGRIKNLNLAGSSGGLQVLVLEAPAAAVDPVRPARARVLAGGLVLGLLLGGLAAMVRDLTDPRLRTLSQVSDALGLPVLGVIPKDRSRVRFEHPLPPASAKTELAEAVRSIRLALISSARDDVRRTTIAITSSKDGDGKSTFAINLAAALAAGGERVLLVDANLRRPTLQEVFQINSGVGLSSILEDDCALVDATHPTGIARLHLLSAGPAAADPESLLNCDRFVQQLAAMAERFDRVIIDCASVYPGSDARIIAAHVDQTVLVLRGSDISRNASERARDGLYNVGAYVVGCVVNGTAASPQVPTQRPELVNRPRYIEDSTRLVHSNGKHAANAESKELQLSATGIHIDRKIGDANL